MINLGKKEFNLRMYQKMSSNGEWVRLNILTLTNCLRGNHTFAAARLETTPALADASIVPILQACKKSYPPFKEVFTSMFELVVTLVEGTEKYETTEESMGFLLEKMAVPKAARGAAELQALKS